MKIKTRVQRVTQLRMGARIEREHKNTIRFIKTFHKKHKRFPADAIIYKSIAKEHLIEDPKYYTKLKKLRL